MHFEKVKEYLDNIGIEYIVDGTIVRGLDYYTKTVFEFKTEDVDIFSEDAAKDDIPISRPERHRKFDVAFSDEDEVKIEKDESLFLSQTDEVEEDEEEGFSFFDDIDLEEEAFEIEPDEESFDADDIFGKADDDEDDDSEGFSFLKNIFGKK